ncbi:GrpB family protein [Nocardioides sp. CFH 31398]|uniref:GrpB family protein n=1 Tax=Nocardioides sp. CFH 31398 TaxID=2919579 RepID=UPI001F0506DA|nr:GrpB family protein [Nocardioides sp. CFH 31398]MCH1866933.1 GrpB family protein [Nocardioides sp. CFH 31398]
MAASLGIVIREYDDRWPAEFEEVARLLRAGLGGLALRVDHIGSTSVPGLAATDVIDVQVSVADLHDSRLLRALEELGATDTGLRTDHVPAGAGREFSAWEKRYVRPPAWRPTHVHVREVGRANTRYALLFRDYLRHSPAAAAAYAEVKLALARLHPDDVEAYYAVKDPACDLVMDAAERWAQQTGWSQDPER